jgi:hypothetical protein
MGLIRALWDEGESLLRALAIEGVISAVPGIVAERTDPVDVADSVVHGVLIRAVMAICSSATNAANDWYNTTASKL